MRKLHFANMGQSGWSNAKRLAINSSGSSSFSTAQNCGGDSGGNGPSRQQLTATAHDPYCPFHSVISIPPTCMRRFVADGAWAADSLHN
ncbi:hypothetical protein Nepgr_016163 [Nepenthes gracilis]|uniref:Uncharacterized protein n=1 Tax=Nepenthes gracilis TaxID=150966 RepID=A0AAD3XR20_NEPGR|nr:hypothetical protein Nepgr_016163 [Nepenthes gracilis]